MTITSMNTLPLTNVDIKSLQFSFYHYHLQKRNPHMYDINCFKLLDQQDYHNLFENFLFTLNV
jgi:hypothetical protein